MERPEPDAARVIVFPPVVPLATLALAWLLQSWLPLGLRPWLSWPLLMPLGVTVAIAGLAMLALAGSTLARSGTAVRPSQPTNVLFETGIFGISRNPMYVGGCLVMLGLALAARLEWMLLLLPLSVMVLHRGIVVPEEAYLERRFGAQYRGYKAIVPRYLGLPRSGR